MCYLHVYLYFGHGQLGKRVLFILVFHIVKPWARLDAIFYLNYTSHVNGKSTDRAL